MRSSIVIAAAVAALGLTVAGSYLAAQDAPAPAAPAGPPPAPLREGLTDFAQLTANTTAQQGLFTILRGKQDDTGLNQTRLLTIIPRTLLKTDLLMATSISRGPMMGFQWEDYLIRFEMIGQRLVVMAPDTRFVESPGQPVNDAVGRTYTPTFLATLPILSYAPNGDPVVDLGGLVTGRPVSLPGAGGLIPRRDISRYNKVKVFPDNVLIDLDAASSTQLGIGQMTGISYSFRRLPDLRASGFASRVADERVGYFNTVRQDWNLRYSERENIVRFVNRWNIRKKDPTLELSPPDRPITFIIEKSVPLQFRKAVADGILEWNKAFEKIGITGAIVVQQQTDDNEFADVDPEDARYNFIRWIVTGRAFAMGPSRADPRTGQILDADIIFDDSMLRAYYQTFDIFGSGGAAAAHAAVLGPQTLDFLIANPQFLPEGESVTSLKSARDQLTARDLMRDVSPVALDAGGAASSAAPVADEPVPASIAAVRARLHGAAAHCNYAAGVSRRVAMLNSVALAAGNKRLADRLINEVVRDIVSHEVGHTLGLRHNFKASAWLTTDEIRKRRDAGDEPTTSSTMDYNELLFFAGDDPQKIRHVTTPTLGPYDLWAIEYGYGTPAQGENEKGFLSRVASQSTKREYAFATDEDVAGLDSPDPLANRWDMAADPLAWAKSRVDLVDFLMKDVRKWAVEKDDPNHYLRSVFGSLLFEKSQSFAYAARIVGGQYHNRNRASDPGAKPALELISPKLQRDALTLLGQTIFSDDFFKVEADLLNHLGPSRWGSWNGDPATRLDYPIHRQILSNQAVALLQVSSPQVLQRVYDAELKSAAEDKFTAAELLGRVRGIVWGDLAVKPDAKFTDAKPMLTSVRRNLQKQHLQYLIAMAESTPGALMSADLHSMVSYTLRDLGATIDATLKSGGDRLDLATRAHLTETRSRIDRVLNGDGRR